ncbi:MAG: hypothetical protein LBM98_00190 [Oscillospiraceae bacterium]|jgi:hypothetical protein|nr:hypothetical protein [Oscillospiraceae bacterium]
MENTAGLTQKQIKQFKALDLIVEMCAGATYSTDDYFREKQLEIDLEEANYERLMHSSANNFVFQKQQALELV